ncbi:MAG: hypothetical protein IJ083_14530 [Clostridia bacterium]|nr:hypothetical protein [Clostridia bacterium]
MKKWLILPAILCLLSTRALAISREDLTGSYRSGEGEIFYEGETDGQARWHVDRGYTGTWRVEGDRAILESQAGDTFSLTLTDGYLVLLDGKGGIYPMVRDVEKLPEKKSGSLDDFQGLWHADFALASGFRMELGGIETDRGTLSLDLLVEEDEVTLMGSAMDAPVTLPCGMLDGELHVPSVTGGGDQVYVLREDGSLTRDMNYMVFHYVRDDGN